eukprot:scaffold49029_cov21-Tisochrysis_lutea.AAC.1
MGRGWPRPQANAHRCVEGYWVRMTWPQASTRMQEFAIALQLCDGRRLVHQCRGPCLNCKSSGGCRLPWSCPVMSTLLRLIPVLPPIYPLVCRVGTA